METGDLLTWFAGLASGFAGLRTVFTWAFLEAILLPLPPEIILIPLVLVHPGRALAFAAAAVTGSLAGGMVSYLLGRRFSQGALTVLKRLPGVNPDRVVWASATLRRLGGRVIALSPWFMLPYKITSVLSGWLSVPLWRYLLAGVIGRGTRLTGMAIIVAAGASLKPAFVSSHYCAALLVSYLSVGLILWGIQRWLKGII